MDIKELQKDINNNSLAHGFWASNREVSETICLIHSEISEALEEYRKAPKDLATVYYENGSKKPEGFGVELADIIIRILDWAEHDGISISIIELKGSMNGNVPHDLAELHKALSRTHIAFEQEGDGKGYAGYRLRVLFNFVLEVAKRNNVDILAMVKMKHEYNKTRIYKHGKAC